MGVKLTCYARTNMAGEPCVAPFINGTNIWDIPIEHWTPDVQRALLSAYERGAADCAAVMTRAAQAAAAYPSTIWPKPEPY